MAPPTDSTVFVLPTLVTQTRTDPAAVKHARDDGDMQGADADVERSMARRKKNEPPMDINKKCSHCDKVFKRPCDFTKHEKTHSRPWKCSQPDCKFYAIGWPTEKERDRHVNDRHSANPAEYHCNFPPCTYTSKRESNCKQHMEKAHGWQYVRSKNNGRRTKSPGSPQSPLTPPVSVPSASQTPTTPAMSTPLSSLSTEPPSPASVQMVSPYVQTMHTTPSAYNGNLFDGYFNVETGEHFSFAAPPMMTGMPVMNGMDFELFPPQMDAMGMGPIPSADDLQHLQDFNTVMDTAGSNQAPQPPSADMSLDQLGVGQDEFNPYCFDNEYLNYQSNGGMHEF